MEPLSLLGIRIDRFSHADIRKRLRDFLRDGRGHQIVTVNPEFVALAQRRPIFASILRRADLAVADGVGIVWASRMLGERPPVRMTGLDLMNTLFEEAQKQDLAVGLIGGLTGVAPLAAERIRKRFPTLRIVIADTEHRRFGWHLPDHVLVSRIRRAKPDILFVAFGAPKQEEWIFHHLHELPSVRIAVGVGGAFDFWAGKVARAPGWMRALGLEWVFRLTQEPWRFPRILTATLVFPWTVLRHGRKHGR
jgi:N-acetylglucosaminyldiphosphoundecaprenol N-acetyl-beta-D-mannosaminyltransferase